MPSAEELPLTFISHHTQKRTCPAKPEGKRLQLPLKHQIIKLRNFLSTYSSVAFIVLNPLNNKIKKIRFSSH